MDIVVEKTPVSEISFYCRTTRSDRERCVDARRVSAVLADGKTYSIDIGLIISAASDNGFAARVTFETGRHYNPRASVGSMYLDKPTIRERTEAGIEAIRERGQQMLEAGVRNARLSLARFADRVSADQAKFEALSSLESAA